MVSLLTPEKDYRYDSTLRMITDKHFRREKNTSAKKTRPENALTFFAAFFPTFTGRIIRRKCLIEQTGHVKFNKPY